MLRIFVVSVINPDRSEDVESLWSCENLAIAAKDAAMKVPANKGKPIAISGPFPLDNFDTNTFSSQLPSGATLETQKEEPPCEN